MTMTTLAPTQGEILYLPISVIDLHDALDAKAISASDQSLYIDYDCSPVIVVELGDGRFKPKYLGGSCATRILASIGSPYVAVRLDVPHGKVTQATREIAAYFKTSKREVEEWRLLVKQIRLEGLKLIVGTSLDEPKELAALCRLDRDERDDLMRQLGRGAKNLSAVSRLAAYQAARLNRQTDDVEVFSDQITSWPDEKQQHFAMRCTIKRLRNEASDLKVPAEIMKSRRKRDQSIDTLIAQLTMLKAANESEMSFLLSGLVSDRLVNDLGNLVTDAEPDASLCELQMLHHHRGGRVAAPTKMEDWR